MILRMKYIMTISSPILFNELLLHTQVALGLKDVVSAGFVQVKWNPNTGFDCTTYGHSESLELSPLESDAQKINEFLNHQKL
jgi:hypothetical protein